MAAWRVTTSRLAVVKKRSCISPRIRQRSTRMANMPYRCIHATQRFWVMAFHLPLVGPERWPGRPGPGPWPAA